MYVMETKSLSVYFNLFAASTLTAFIFYIAIGFLLLMPVLADPLSLLIPIAVIAPDMTSWDSIPAVLSSYWFQVGYLACFVFSFLLWKSLLQITGDVKSFLGILVFGIFLLIILFTSEQSVDWLVKFFGEVIVSGVAVS